MRTAPRRDGESAVQPPLPSMAGLLNSPAHLAVYVPRSRAIDHASILIHGWGGAHPQTDARLSHVGKGATVVYVYAVVVTVLNLGFWVGILFSLPRTWLRVLVTAVLKWWQPEYVQVSWTVLSVAGGLAVLGEVLEFPLGAAGSRRGIYSGGGLGHRWQPRWRGRRHGTPDADCRHPDRRLCWSLCRLAAGGSLGGAPAVPELPGGLGGGRGPVLGDPLQTCHRRHHGARPGAGRVLLTGMNRRLCICTLTLG
jgi:hypothetical protein